MGLISERSTKYSNLVKYEQGESHGFCREVKTVTLTPTSEIGDVLRDNSGNLTLVAVANTAAAEAILVEADLESKRPATGTANVDCAVLVRGGAIVADKQLNYNADINTDAEKAALYAVLEGKGIIVRKQA